MSWTSNRRNQRFSSMYYISTISCDPQQILLVTGGFNPTYNYLSSTEISTNQGSTWTELASAALPSARIGPRAITVNNRVLVLGIDIYNM